MVARLCFQLIGDVHRTIFHIGLDVWHQFLLVKVPHLCQLTQRAHDVGLAIQLTRFSIKFAAHYVLVHARVTYYINRINGSRLSLIHAHLKINGIIINAHFNRFYIKEEIPLIGIEFRYRIIILVQAFIELLEVVGVTFLNTQYRIQIIVRIDRVAHPLDITKDIFLSLIYSQIDIYTRGVLWRTNDTIRQNNRITITNLIVFFNDQFLIVFKFGSNELLGTEEVDNVIIICLLHRKIDLVIRQSLVALNVYMPHLGLDFLIYINRYFDIARVVFVIKLQYLDGSIVVSFFFQILDNHLVGAIFQVRCHLSALLNTHFHLNIFHLRFAQAVVSNIRDTWTLFQSDF